MNNSEDKKLIYFLIGLPVIILAFVLGMYFGGTRPSTAGSAQQAMSSSDGSAVQADQFSVFWKAWKILHEKDVNEASSTDTAKIYGAIQGLAASYNDPYTVFFPPAQSKEFAETIAGNFGGVGMEVGIKAGQIVVIAPLKDSPAMAAGVKTGDAILSINGTSTQGMSVDQAVNYIRGDIGTKVKISFLPQGSTKPVDRTLTRAVINIPTIDTKDLGNGIFQISLYSFTAQSPDLFRNALQQFKLSGDTKLILDLRGNPGGYLDAAWDMASYFLPAGKTVVTEDFGKNGPPQVYTSKGHNAFPTKVPMVVLVDGGSASAAEILAGALHEQGYATLVGTKTFGKGVVQELVPITADTSLKVTVARWLTPLGHNLSHDGLDPDYKVEITDADRAASHDAQLEKAKALLTAQQ